MNPLRILDKKKERKKTSDFIVICVRVQRMIEKS